MNRGIWGLLLVVVIMTTNADAGKWKPYVGVHGTFGSPIVSYNLDLPNNIDWLPVGFSAGAQFEVGLQKQGIFYYIGYNYLNSESMGHFTFVDIPGETPSYTKTNEEYWWRERRILFGMRYRPSGVSKLRAVIGSAISVGRFVFEHEFEKTYALPNIGEPAILDKSSQNRQSDISVGLMIECGVALRLSPRLDFTVISQFHRYESFFGHDPYYYTPDHVVVFSPQLCLGMQYTIEKLSF